MAVNSRNFDFHPLAFPSDRSAEGAVSSRPNFTYENRTNQYIGRSYARGDAVRPMSSNVLYLDPVLVGPTTALSSWFAFNLFIANLYWVDRTYKC